MLRNGEMEPVVVLVTVIKCSLQAETVGLITVVTKYRRKRVKLPKLKWHVIVISTVKANLEILNKRC